MTARSYYKQQFQYSIENGVTTLYCKVLIGAAGAVTSYKGLGVSAVTLNGTGDYTLTLDRKYKALLGLNLGVVQATAQGLIVSVKTDSVASAGTLNVITSVGSTATAPSSATTLAFEIILKDSTQRAGIQS